jgi:DNA-binding CsgD family transcriptional regulator
MVIIKFFSLGGIPMTIQPQGQKQSPKAASLPDVQGSGADDIISTSLAEYTQMFVHLFNIGQVLCGQTQGVAERFCQEVALVTQGRAQLRLHYHKSAGIAAVSAQALSSGFPVQFRDRDYGTLYVVSDPTQIVSPILPLPVAQVLAQTCGWLLFTFELAACFPGLATQSEQQTNRALTRREKEVLVLMCQGYGQEAIARALSITPATVSKHRQHIYERLGVRNERDAILVAYQEGLFSPLEDLTR